MTDDLLAFYEPIAAAGTPLMITGYLYVSEQGKAHPGQAGVDSDDQGAGLRDWAAVLKSHGGLAVAQINHAGRQIAGARDAVSASGVREPLMGTKPRALRRNELPAVIESFAAAAGRAAEAGFDGVQIHFVTAQVHEGGGTKLPAWRRVAGYAAAPVCGFCNGCIARAGGTRIDCYSDEIRARRDAMLAAADPEPTTTPNTARRS